MNGISKVSLVLAATMLARAQNPDDLQEMSRTMTAAITNGSLQKCLDKAVKNYEDDHTKNPASIAAGSATAVEGKVWCSASPQFATMTGQVGSFRGLILDQSGRVTSSREKITNAMHDGIMTQWTETFNGFRRFGGYHFDGEDKAKKIMEAVRARATAWAQNQSRKTATPKAEK